MPTPEQVQHPGVYVEFTGRDPKAARELSALVRLFLMGSMYRVEYLSDKVKTTTLVVYDDK